MCPKRQPGNHAAELEASRQQMLDQHLRARGISDDDVLEAMAYVPRELFVPKEMWSAAYDDCALQIDCGQTISQPYIVGLMTQELELNGTQRVLEIGTGSGYQSAVLAQLAREIVSVERHSELSSLALRWLNGLDCSNVKLVVGDGSLGWPDLAPYDRIIVTAGARECPKSLLNQLVEGGIVVIPIGSDNSQELVKIRKKSEGICWQKIANCRFVPLVGEQGWPQ